MSMAEVRYRYRLRVNADQACACLEGVFNLPVRWGTRRWAGG